MNEVQHKILSIFKAHLFYGIVLAFSLFFFFYKGFSYLVIGSYVPLILISAIMALFIFSSRKSEKSFRKTIGLWAILVIIWSSIRLLLGLVNQFIKPVPESHVAEQFGLFGSLFSLLFLFGAIYLWRYKNRLFEK